MIVRVRGTSAAPPALGISTPRPCEAGPKALTPNAKATGLAGVLQRPQALPHELSETSTAVGNALSQLASAEPVQFAATKLDRASAERAVAAGRAAITALIGDCATLHGFTPRLAFTDELGRVNVRFARVYDGVPIFGAEVITHMKGDAIVDITGSALPANLGVDTQPTTTGDAAMAVARRAFVGAPERTTGPQLIIAKTDDGAYHLAYPVTLVAYGDAEGPRKIHYFVDAHSSTLLTIGFTEHRGAIPPHMARPTGATSTTTPGAPKALRDAPAGEAGTGNSVYSGQVKLTTTKVGNAYVLRDPTAHGAETRDAHNRSGGDSESVFTDNNNVWAEPSDSPRVRDSVDAQYGATQYLRYLKDMFGRDSLDDKGWQLISYVHIRVNYGNAYWDGEAMNYGDGDGDKYLTTVDTDTCGHEVTHGVTEHTSNLIYRGEAGALNEAGSDIIGAAGFSWFLRGHKDAGILKDYLLFEDSFTAGIEGDAIRYMNEPKRDGTSRDNYKDRYTGGSDNGGVHRNSGIANNFFYLLAAGGTNPTSGIKVEHGLGIEKALRIYYRAHTVYFTPSTNFAQARKAWVKAATDLFGADSVEVKTVEQAATAVGIDNQPSSAPTLIA